MLIQIRVKSCVELIERIIFICDMLIVTRLPSDVRLKIVGVRKINCGHSSCKQHLCYSRIMTIIEYSTIMSQVLGVKDKLLLCQLTKVIMLQQVVAVRIISKAVNCPLLLLYC